MVFSRAKGPVALDAVKEVLLFVFSGLFLTAVSVIVSGKFAAKVFPLGFLDTDEFNVNLIVIRLKAKGDEVSLGFCLFILSMVITVWCGGPAAYEVFRRQSGIDVGQWNSLCILASVLCLFESILIYSLSRLLKPRPLVSNKERDEVIEKLKNGQ